MDDPRDRKRPEPGRRISIALAVAVHLVLIVFLVYGVQWQSEKPESIEVELVQAVPSPATATPPPAPEPKPEPLPEPKVTPKAQPASPPPKPDIAIKEKPRKKEEVPSPFNPFNQMLQQEEKRRVTDRQIADEEKRISDQKAAQAKGAHDKAAADYLSKIRAKIRGNIVLPPEVKGNPEALFLVTQLPSGEIISAKLSRTSGNAALDAAIERAILKSSPLPKPDQAGLFDRNLELRFRPLDE